MSAARACPVDGTELLHMDVRSDNICLVGAQAVLVDWNVAAVGAACIDVAFWLPSLAAEGGPLPGAVLPDAPNEAAVVAGFFAARAGLPVIPSGAASPRRPASATPPCIGLGMRRTGLVAAGVVELDSGGRASS